MEEFDLVLWFQKNFQIILFVAIQIILLIYARHNLTKKDAWHTHTNIWASILTVIGVFGTFLGIYFGLLDFDHKNIEGSIPTLLDGLKHAFLTSLVGIVSAIFLKFRALLHEKKNLSSDGIKEFVETLTDTLKEVETSGESNLSAKLDKLIEIFKGESNEIRKVLNSMKTELASEQKQQGEQTRETLIGMQSALIEEQTNTITHLQSLTETVKGVTPALAALETSLISKHTDTLTQLETLTTTVSEKQSELLNGVKDALTPIQTSLMDEQTGVLTKLEALTTTVSEKHDALLNGTTPALTAIQDSLTDNETGVLTKLEALTVTVSDEHDKLRTEFETFSNNVAESITKLATNELISALSDIIEQFNAKITAQFGDNFKQLNDAVGKTVEWQQQYREQMNELTDEFLLALEGIEKSQNALENIANSSSAIVERSDSIVSCAEKLEPILHTMNDQLEAFSTLRQNANDAFPLIEERLNELTNGFSSTVQEAITNSETSMKAQREAFSEQSDQLKSVIDGLDSFTTRIDGVTQNVLNTINNLQEGIDVQKNISDDLMQRLVSMQSTLEQELTESVNTLAGKLAALSEKFVEDYTPLTERLREVIMISEGVRPRNPRN